MGRLADDWISKVVSEGGFGKGRRLPVRKEKFNLSEGNFWVLGNWERFVVGRPLGPILKG